MPSNFNPRQTVLDGEAGAEGKPSNFTALKDCSGWGSGSRGQAIEFYRLERLFWMGNGEQRSCPWISIFRSDGQAGAEVMLSNVPL